MWKNCDRKQTTQGSVQLTQNQIPIFATIGDNGSLLVFCRVWSMEFHLIDFLNLNIMRLNLLVCALVGFSAQAQNLADTQWQLYPGAGAGRRSEPGRHWLVVQQRRRRRDRACLFDDIYAFNADGSFQNILGDETWVGWLDRRWRNVRRPVAPHDGSAAASWSVAGSELTLDGVGAFMGLAKVFNGGELGNPADAPSINT